MLVVNGGNTSALGELGDLPPSLIVHVPSTPKSSAAQWDDLKKKVINNDVEGFMPTAHIIVNEMQYIHRAQSFSNSLESHWTSGASIYTWTEQT